MKRINPLVLCLCAWLLPGAANSQVPKLNSYPAASSVIYLDFDGHVVQGTSWNWNGPIHCAASMLTPDQVETVFNRVAEDFRPFQINITTDSAKFLSAPLARRYRLILTSSSAWYGNAAGVAMIGSFSWGDDTPGFVFTNLLSLNPSNIGKAASHEIGHALGLYHQVLYDQNCIQVSEYHPGHGNGQLAWAPIMGVTYYRNMSGWHNGPNFYGCQVNQDELNVITTQNGFGFRQDDHASDIRQATNTSFSGNSLVISGVIENPADMDFFKINLDRDSRLTVEALPFSLSANNAGANLDLEISLYDRKRKWLGTYNPESILNAAIDTFLEKGSYYIGVDGVGNAFAPDYSCLGSYSLVLTLVSNARPAPSIDKVRVGFNEITMQPKLLGNSVYGNLQVQVHEPTEYIITDMQGVLYRKGKLSAGQSTLILPMMKSGFYLLRFTSAAGSYTEKFFHR